MILLGKTSLILFLIGLLNNKNRSESLLYHYNHNQLTSLPPSPPQYLATRSFAENILATLLPSANLLYPNNNNNFNNNPKLFVPNYLPNIAGLRNIPYHLTMSNGGSWSHQLPFSMGSCDSIVVVDPEFNQCRSKASFYWSKDSYLMHYTSNRHTCCYVWNILDCFEEAIRRRCQYSLDLFQRNRLSYISRIQADPVCYNVPYNSIKCYHENWIWILFAIILAFLIGIFLCAALWVLWLRRRKQQQHGNNGFSSNDDDLDQYDVERTIQKSPQTRKVSTGRSAEASTTSRSPSRSSLRRETIEADDEEDVNIEDDDRELNVFATTKTQPSSSSLRRGRGTSSSSPYYHQAIQQQPPPQVSTVRTQRTPEARSASVVTIRQIEV